MRARPQNTYEKLEFRMKSLTESQWDLGYQRPEFFKEFRNIEREIDV